MGFMSTTDSIISILRYQFSVKVETLLNRIFMKIVKKIFKVKKGLDIRDIRSDYPVVTFNN